MQRERSFPSTIGTRTASAVSSACRIVSAVIAGMADRVYSAKTLRPSRPNIFAPEARKCSVMIFSASSTSALGSVW